MFKNKVIRTDDMRVIEVIPVKEKKKKKEVSSSQSSVGEGSLTSWRPGTEGSLYPSELQGISSSSGLDLWPLPAPSGPRDEDQESEEPAACSLRKPSTTGRKLPDAGRLSKYSHGPLQGSPVPSGALFLLSFEEVPTARHVGS